MKNDSKKSSNKPFIIRIFLILALIAAGIVLHVHNNSSQIATYGSINRANLKNVEQPSDVRTVSQIINTKFYIFFDDGWQGNGRGVHEDSGSPVLLEEEIVVPPVYDFISFCYNPGLGRITFVGKKKTEEGKQQYDVYSSTGKLLHSSSDHSVNVEGFINKKNILITCVESTYNEEEEENVYTFSYFLINVKTGEKKALSKKEAFRQLEKLRS